jgi:hypothetical protein
MTLLLLAIGLGAGVLSGIFGIGGGIVIVPALLYLAKMTPQQASGTSLGALLLPVGALGAWSYYKAGQLEWKASLLVALGLFIGVYFGAELAHHLDATMLKKGFALLLVVMAVKLWVG